MQANDVQNLQNAVITVRNVTSLEKFTSQSKRSRSKKTQSKEVSVTVQHTTK